MGKLILAGAVGWLIPGGGYLVFERWVEGALLFAASLILIVTGWLLGGLYYPGNPVDFGAMYWLHQFSGAGNGIFVILNFLFKENIESSAAAKAFSAPTFEHAGRCLALAGLLNYLALIHIFDTYQKRGEL